MKTLFLAASLVAVSVADAQDRIVLVPNWKVGDVRNLHYTEKTYEIENDTVRRDVTQEWDARLKVTKSTGTAFIAEMLYKDATLRQMEDFHKQLASAPAYKDLTLRFKVDKATGEAELENWEEAQTFLKGEFDLMTSAIGSEDAEAGAAFKDMLAPMMGYMTGKENVQAYFAEGIGAVTATYGKSLMQRDTIRIKETVPNPFQPSDSVTTTTLMTISNHDIAKQRIVIRSEVLFDMERFNRFMRDMMTKMLDGLVQNEKDKAAAKKKMQAEIADLEMNIKTQSITTLSTLTSWPVKVVTTSRVTAKQPGKSGMTTVTRTVDLRE